MTLGSWDPKSVQESSAFQIDPQQLQQFILLADNGELDNISKKLSSEQLQQQAALMQLPASDWNPVITELNSADIISLIRFFTCAETLPGWQAGEKSPVITLTKQLKKRGEKLERELLLWIRQHSYNRFLPYGSL